MAKKTVEDIGKILFTGSYIDKNKNSIDKI